MRSTANMPGIGGSLGMCALCGDTFMAEILLGRAVPVIEIEGMDKDVCVHQKCLTVLEKNGPNWRTLPDGPLRRAYAKAAGEEGKTADAVDPQGGSETDGPRASDRLSRSSSSGEAIDPPPAVEM